MDTLTEVTRSEFKTIRAAWRSLHRMSNVFQPSAVYRALEASDPACDPESLGDKMLAGRAIEPTGENEDLVTIDHGEWMFFVTD